MSSPSYQVLSSSDPNTNNGTVATSVAEIELGNVGGHVAGDDRDRAQSMGSHSTGSAKERSRSNSACAINGNIDFGEYYADNTVTAMPPPRERAMTFTPAAPENSPTILTFTGLSVATKSTPPKVLLKNINGSITGGLWGIMGASGSGKTTLLSALSLRLDPRFMDIQGEFRLNGREYSRNDLKSMSGYLMQDDLLFAELTVYETLWYAAELRMYATTKNSQERAQRIEEVLKLLEIPHTRNTIIGNSRRKGVSGGERKRVSVAIEMLNRPDLLFMDGPTTGLDSTTAFTVCKVFKKMTEMGECTMVCTMEQPSPRVFRLFDNLILLKQGELFYIGHSMKTVKFLEVIGQPCPSDLNMADHLVNLISDTQGVHGGEDGLLQYEATHVIDEHIKNVPVDLSLGLDKPIFSNEGATSWLHEYYILTQRCLQHYLRRTDVIFFNFVATIIISIFISCGAWYDVGTTQESIKSMLPPLFFVVVNQGVVGSIQTVTSFPSERAIMLRERASGSYQTSSYFLAKTTSDFITSTWTPAVFSIIVYFTIGYEHTASKFFIYMFFLMLTSLAAMSLSTAGKSPHVIFPDFC
jgi:ATP-binding cassette subfamily G (WHITE) protein 2